jgi:hypothetical protein
MLRFLKFLYFAFHSLIIGLAIILFGVITTLIYSILFGLNIEADREFEGVYVGNIFIKYEDKFSIVADEVRVEIKENNETTEIPDLSQIFGYVKMAQKYIGEIRVEKLNILDIEAKISYKNGNIEIFSEPYILKIETEISERGFYAKIPLFAVREFDVVGDGEIFLNFENSELLAEINGNSRGLKLNVLSKLEDFEKVSVSIKSEKIYNLNPILDLIDLRIPALKNLSYEFLKIENAKTKFSISQPEKALDNLFVTVKGENIGYRFEPLLPKGEIGFATAILENGNLEVQLKNGKYGDTDLSGKAEIENILQNGILRVDANTILNPNSKTIKETIKYYSGLDSLPVQIRGNLDTNFKMEFPFDGDLKFIINSQIIEKRVPKSNKLPNLSSGKLKLFFPSLEMELLKIGTGFGTIAETEISGKLDLKKSELDLDAEIERVFLDENSSLQKKSFAKISGNYLEKIDINLDETFWKFANIPVSASPFFASYNIGNSFAEVKNLGLDVRDYNFTGEISGNFDVKKMGGDSEIEIEKLHFSELNISSEKIHVFYQIADEVAVQIPKLDFDLKVAEKTEIEIGKIELFTPFVPLTKKYPPIFGDVSVEISEKIEIDSHLKIENQHVLKNGNEFVRDFNISGEISGEKIKFGLNRDVFFMKNGEKMNLVFHNYDLNLSALSEFTGENKKSEKAEESENNSSFPDLKVFLKENTIYLNEKPLLVDLKNGFVKIDKNGVSAQTNLASRGEIHFQMVGDKFIAKGLNLDQKFLFNLTKFDGISGGNYNLYAKGEGKNISGIVQFTRLKVKDMELVNNLLAFINTVPALLTLSRPGFNHNGLWITAGYGVFEKRGDLIELQDVKIYGETVNMDLSGKIDLANESLDLQIDISAVKYLDKFIGNIPIANYMILGEKGSLSTGITVKGSFDNPKIAPELHKEIISTPIVIGKRILKLPQKVLEFIKSLNLEDKEGKEELKKLLSK